MATTRVTRLAITRPPTAALARCVLTYRKREPVDVDLAIDQHSRYERALESLGCTVLRLPLAPDLPDAVFVEDAAVVLGDVAVVGRSAEPSRRAELPDVVRALEPYCDLLWIREPGTLDGGDVLAHGRTLLVGRSSRTNDQGVAQLREPAESAGYRVQVLAVDRCLHLRTALSSVGEGTLLVNPDWIDASDLDAAEVIAVDRAEPWGANALRIGSTVIHPDSSRATRRLLEQSGIDVRPVPFSELEKAEAGVTCCSLIIEPSASEAATAR